jgi:hypothetical protein
MDYIYKELIILSKVIVKGIPPLEVLKQILQYRADDIYCRDDSGYINIFREIFHFGL